MRKFLFAAAATVAIAAPAAAKDDSPYVGIEGGVLFPQKQTVFGSVDFTDPTLIDIARTDVASTRYKMGYDVDVIGGYDFGMFRLEGELGYKRAKTKSLNVNSAFVTGLNAGAGTSFTSGTNFGIDDHTSVYSAMLNGLLDLGGNGGIGGYVGGGAGYASVHQFGGSSGKFAWQLLAGVYMPISSNVDVGLKYRYFRAGRSGGTVAYPFAAGTGTCTTVCSGGTAYFDNDSRFTSHSLLASLVYNFGGTAVAPPPPPPPPPPPAPAAPATQTCPDGSVIAATEACPAPPAPPPPPAPVERGERGR
jgi:opacity protein-like surface antigen